VNRFVVQAKRRFSEDISVCLIHSERTVTKTPALKKEINGEPVIANQIKIIKNTFGEAVDLAIVTGYEADPIENYLNRTVRVVRNEHYDDVDIGHSIWLGIKNTISKNVYFIDGRMPLSGKEFIPAFESYLTIQEKGEVGAVIQNEKIINLSYGVSPKIANVIYLAGAAVNKFVDYYRDELIYWEVLNLLLEKEKVVLKPIFI
jgi:hypothetical protein